MPAARRPYPLLFLAAAVMVITWVCVAAFFVVDPLALYPWGVTPKLKDVIYSMRATPYLVDVVAKDPRIDTLFIGGSTGHPFSAKLMEEILPGTQHAFNLSYGSPRPADREAVAAQVLKYGHMRHVLYEMDWRFQLPKAVEQSADVTGNAFPAYFYDDTIWNDVRGIGLKTISLTWKALLGKPLWLSSWAEDERGAKLFDQYKAFHAPGAVEAYKGLIESQRANIDNASSWTCADLDSINDDLVPFVRELSKRNVAVDIVMPVYSYLLYYEWIDKYRRLSVSGRNFMNDHLLMRHCAAFALDGIPNVRVFAFDNIPGLADDIRNYRDEGHLYNDAVIRYALQSVAAGTNRLTRDNVDAQNAQLRERIKTYQLTDSRLWQPLH